MTTNTDTQGGGVEAVRRTADLLDENAECYSENAMDRAFLGNSEELAALIVKYLALAASPAAPEDGRPDGWTEALAISFMAANGMGMFAKSFNEGAWAEINEEWPEFVAFAERRLGAAPDAKE